MHNKFGLFSKVGKAMSTEKSIDVFSSISIFCESQTTKEFSPSVKTSVSLIPNFVEANDNFISFPSGRFAT